ncbi:MAG TPA: lipoate--protein ligase [Microscillaceae bacterium]|jgi:lipoate-protein ligase A|nr:lipoate--protein ligase [Microscillaceae bacterium]
MLLIDNQNIHDPKINLALEEYVVRNFSPDQDYVLFYINKPSLIIGKHQNTIEEINQDFVHEHDIIVVRRISGGGTVYHDLGNLNFSFLTKFDPSKVNNFEQFTRPIVQALKALGVDAEVNGRNDITVDGRKISGNAQFSTTKSMFSHGTLLFNSEMSKISGALNVKADKIESKGIKSVRSRVANIMEFLKEPITMDVFKQTLLKHIFGDASQVPTYRLSEEQWAEVYKLSEEKYQTWEWNYGRSPEFNIQRVKRFDFGLIDARVHVKDGVLTAIRFYGDFLGFGDLHDIETKLIGQQYRNDHLVKALLGVDLTHYFGAIAVQDFIDFICD